MQGTGCQIPPVPLIFFQKIGFGGFTLGTLCYFHRWTLSWTLAMSTSGRRRGPYAGTFKVCFMNLSFWRCPWVDICKVKWWTSLSSSRVIHNWITNVTTANWAEPFVCFQLHPKGGCCVAKIMRDLVWAFDKKLGRKIRSTNFLSIIEEFNSANSIEAKRKTKNFSWAFQWTPFCCYVTTPFASSFLDHRCRILFRSTF
jgi:hypothetical protein